jgi:RNA polymerase sigma factor (sigma-70 family)
MNENEIIRGCIEGYPEFQKALYETFYKKMMGICIRYSGEEEEAHKILQEGFITIYKNFKRYKDSEPLEVWLKKNMIDTAITHIRSDKDKRMIVSTVHENKGNTKQKSVDVSDETLIQELSKTQMLTALQSLTSGYRIVYNLFFIDGFTHEQIAEILNISTDTSKTNLEKARFAFRKNLIQYVNTDAK